MRQITNAELAARAYLQNQDPARRPQLIDNLHSLLPRTAWKKGVYISLAASADAKDQANAAEATQMAKLKEEELLAERRKHERDVETKRRKADRLVELLDDAGLKAGDSVMLSPSLPIWQRERFGTAKLIGRQGDCVMVEGPNGPVEISEGFIHAMYRR